MIIILILIIVVLYFVNSKSKQTEIEKAYEIAVKQIRKKNVDYIILKEEKKDKYYDVTFIDDKYSYEFKIDMDLGKIIEENTNKLKDNEEVTYISEEQIKKIALETAELKEKEVAGLTIKKYTKDNRVIYNVIFLRKNHLYDCEIDAVTGGFINSKVEREK